MTDTTTNDTSGQRTYDAVLADAVRMLTEASRRAVTWTDGDGRERRSQADFAEFVTRAVAGAAANIGSVELALAGRPGSWEADKVRDMLHATVGYDEQYLLEYRTEPVVVRVHVDDILNDLGVWDLYDAAHAELDHRLDAVGNPEVGGIAGTPEVEDSIASLEQATPEQEAACEAIYELRDRLELQQLREWAEYGAAFKANVLQAANELLPGLRVPVEAIVELEWQDDLGLSDAELEWGGPAARLWEAARLATPLPGAGIALRDDPVAAHSTVAQIESAASRSPLARMERGEAQR
jgi:hypothetical protein